ncbi:TIGR03557 family F420-dependent LLM class oxidoreductase [Streptomyces polyrhachis]|uniref:TIGR03557 family F420-dependent LLM class oxidoreductase n=1 Tax=Streptomyces polyrhachis TaxID=1282885 RepID=A0ABW2GKS9_9ACTN
MATFGYFLSSEEHPPNALVEQAALAEQAGFESLWISDHYHPWLDSQGEASFVWAVIGALTRVCELPITTAVTCPTVRIHPAIIAQAAATAQILAKGRFRLGVGSGENLNEHILGDDWPAAQERLDMLEEAVGVIRELFTGELVTHHGEYYTVETAKLYSLPDELPPIYVSGLGHKSAALAGRIGEGYISTMPDAALVERFRATGGAGKPTQAGLKVCWGPDEAAARELAYDLWRNEVIPGQSPRLLPLPVHFEEVSRMVRPEDIKNACGPDPQQHIDAIKRYLDAGFDEIHIAQIGPDQKGFFDFYEREVLPAVRAL